MNNLNKLTIFNFFGIVAQHKKLREEVKEVFKAFYEYMKNPNMENLLHLIEELNDSLNVAEGILIGKGGNVEETQREKEMKIYKTMKIVKQIPSHTKLEDRAAEYDKIRRG